MVAKLIGRGIAAAILVGCGEAEGANIATSAPQPSADLDKGAKATTIEDWAKANPNNGAAGSGETESK